MRLSNNPFIVAERYFLITHVHKPEVQSPSSFTEALYHKLLWPLRDINLLYGSGYVCRAFFFPFHFSLFLIYWAEVSSQAAPLSANKASETLRELFGLKQQI